MILCDAYVLFTRTQHTVRLRPFRMVRTVRQELALQRQTLPGGVVVMFTCRGPLGSYRSRTAGQGRWCRPSSVTSHPQTRPVRQVEKDRLSPATGKRGRSLSPCADRHHSGNHGRWFSADGNQSYYRLPVSAPDKDPHLIDRQIRVRRDLEFVAADIGLIAVKVEIGVVSQVDRARLVDDRAVLNGDTIIFGQGKACGCGEIAWEAPSPSRESRENQTSPSFCCTIFQRRLSNPSGPPCS